LKGIYILIIEIDKNVSIKIGALGKLTFSEGLYAYVGSAQNNLELRVKRHRGKKKRLFWHIDYLLKNPAAKTVNVLYKESDKTEECKIASLLQQNAEPIPGFGSSDCRCKSHLFKSSQFNFLQKYMQPLNLDKLGQRIG
jgi:Uri superfamily endonuclease